MSTKQILLIAGIFIGLFSMLGACMGLGEYHDDRSEWPCYKEHCNPCGEDQDDDDDQDDDSGGINADDDSVRPDDDDDDSARADDDDDDDSTPGKYPCLEE